MQRSQFNPNLLLAFLVLLPSAARAESDTLQYPPPAEVKVAFLQLLDRAKVAADLKELEPTRSDRGLRYEHLDIATEESAPSRFERMPMLVVRPEKPTGKLPAVIVLHGTGGNKESMQPLLVDLAHRGYLGVAIDARYHGERSGGAEGAAAYNQAITNAWRAKSTEKQEHPFYFDTCWDLWRLVDYLTARDDVDPERIGMVGFSMGGIETWLAAAVDERVRVAVPVIAVQSFRWSLEHDAWHARARTIGAAHNAARADLGELEVNERVCRALWSKVVPGILDQFDGPSMIRLFAGRPLLILNGELDPNCPLAGAQLAFAAAREAFSAAGAPDLLRIEVAKGVGHAVTPGERKLAIGWFDKWLKR